MNRAGPADVPPGRSDERPPAARGWTPGAVGGRRRPLGGGRPATPQRRWFSMSAAVQAVMLAVRRTVADAVRMWTGRAAPSSTGPIATLLPAAVLSRL